MTKKGCWSSAFRRNRKTRFTRDSYVIFRQVGRMKKIAAKMFSNCVSVSGQYDIKSAIHPPEGGGAGGIKKVADNGRFASGCSAEVEGGQGVASGCMLQDVLKHEGENPYQSRLIGRLSPLITRQDAGLVTGAAARP